MSSNSSHNINNSLSSNCSATVDSELPTPVVPAEITQLVITTALGLIVVVLNTIVGSVILKFKRLRERPELGVLLGLIISDVTCGLAYITISVRIIFLRFAYDELPLSTFECMQKFQSFAGLVGPEAICLMVLVVSIDRLISMSSITYYSTLGRRYVTVALGVPAVMVLSSYVSVWVYVVLEVKSKQVPNICFGNAFWSKGYIIYHNAVQIVPSTLSVVIYCVVIFLMNRRLKAVPKGQMETTERRQVKMTKTVGFMCLCTLVLYVIPDSIILFFSYVFTSSSVSSSASIACRTATSAYSCCNIIVFLLRPSDVKSHMRVVWERIRYCGRVVEPAPFNIPLNGLNVLLAAPTLPSCHTDTHPAKSTAQVDLQELYRRVDAFALPGEVKAVTYAATTKTHFMMPSRTSMFTKHT